MKYLFVSDDSFGFKADDIHEILETDISISDDIYDRFFTEQAQGKQFRVRDASEATFEEIFEEVPKETTPLTPEQEIIKLKTELEETDYKVIKCYEYQLAGLDMPYDITELHTSRQVIRDKINELMEVQNG